MSASFPTRPRGARWTWEIRCRAHARAIELGRELPFDAFVPWDGRVRWTEFEGGKRVASGGRVREAAWPEFAARLSDYAQTVVAKGTGRSLSGGISKNGRRCDEDASAIGLIGFDSDLGHGLGPLAAALERAGAASVIEDSSSSRPDWPKAHVWLPLSAEMPAPWKPKWMAIYAWTLGYIEAVADMAGPTATGAARLTARDQAFAARHGVGLDPTTDGLLSLRFAPARRPESPDAPAPLVRRADGRALDLATFARTTGYDSQHVRALWESIRSGDKAEPPVAVLVAHGEPTPRAGRPAPADLRYVLARALAYAGWLGPWAAGAWACRCPWWTGHGDAVADPARSEWSARVFPRAGGVERGRAC